MDRIRKVLILDFTCTLLSGLVGVMVSPSKFPNIAANREPSGVSECFSKRKDYPSPLPPAWLGGRHFGETYNLNGEPISQQQLADDLNKAFGPDLGYPPLTVEEYLRDRIAEFGEFLGSIIVGIYEGICSGKFATPSIIRQQAGSIKVGTSVFPFSRVRDAPAQVTSEMHSFPDRNDWITQRRV